jgi:hypothetical protein
VEASLRILLNSVPYLIGCAVVRQPAGPDAIAAEVGRNPWLFDRRLTTLQLPDDSLPANRAVALDWPVPYQAEWVGVPPRLLISRLVFGDRTVGVLLGTLITREPLTAQTREAMDLSCELIASAMAMDSAGAIATPSMASGATPSIAAPDSSAPALAAPTDGASSSASAPPSAGAAAGIGIDVIVSQLVAAVAAVDDARAVGRILRDAMNEVSEASAFAVALFHTDRPEVAYRYKVVGVDAASSELGKQPVDDSPSCFAVRNREPWHAFDRTVTIGGERRRVTVLQVPLTAATESIGVVTLQTFRAGFAQGELELIAAIVHATAPAFATARAAGRFQPSTAAAARSAQHAEAPAVPAAATTDEILSDLLVQGAAAGFPTSFILGLDPQAGVLRGDRVSGSTDASAIDRMIGISDSRFAVSVDDRYNAIARACREARMISAPTFHELVQPAHDWNEAVLAERAAGGGRSAIAPIVVNGDVVGALVVGPRAEEFTEGELEQLRSLVDAVGQRLAGAWRAASVGGAGGVDVSAVTLQAARSESVA